MPDYRKLATSISLALAKALLALTLVAVVLVSIGLTTGVFTAAIASRLVATLNSRTSLAISYDEIEGVPMSDLRIKGLALQLGAQKIRADDVQMSWNPFQLMSGLVDIETLKLSGVALVIDNSAEADEASDEPSIQTIEPLGINIILAELIVDGFTLDIADQIVTLDTLQTALNLDERTIALSGIFVRLNDNEITGVIDLAVGNNPSLNADLAWYSPAVLSVIPASVLKLIPQLGTETPSGQLVVNGWTEQLAIQHSLQTPFEATSVGTLTNPLSLTDLEFSLEHEIDSLTLDTNTGTLTTVNRLAIFTAGDLTTQRFSAAASIEDARLSAVEFSTNGTLAQTKLAIEAIELRSATGIATADIEIDFADATQISGSYTLQDTAPLNLFTVTTPFELTNLTSTGDFTASLDNQLWNGRLRILDLLGDLSGYPLQGAASFSLLNGTPIIDQLRLSTNDNSLSIDGNPADAAGLRWNLTAPALNQLLPDAAGSINGSGRLSTAGDSMSVAGSLTADAIEFQSYYGDGVSIAFDFAQDAVAANVELRNIGIVGSENQELISAANLKLTGNPLRHTLSGDVSSPYLSLTSALQGSFRQTGANWDWTGSLSTAEIDSSYGLWQLRSALNVSINDSLVIAIDGGCFGQGETRLCVTLNGRAEESLEAEFALENLQLSQFNQADQLGFNPSFITPALPQLPAGFLVSGLVTSSLLMTFGASSPAIDLSVESTGTKLIIDPSQFTDAVDAAEADYERQTYQIDRFSISASGTLDSLGLSSQIEINEINLNDEPLAAPGQISTQLLISNLSDLEGEVKISLPSLEWLAAVIPQASNVQGALVSNLRLGGNFAQPILGGNIQFTNLALDIDALGIKLFDVNLTAQQTQNTDYSIVASLSSNEGSIAVAGQVSDLFLSSWSANAQFSGSDFLFINRPEVSMVASPELSLNASSQLIDIKGHLGVPKLQLDVEGLPDTAIDVSRDVVIASYSSSVPNQDVNAYVDERSLFSIPIAADVSVALENDIGFTGFGITAQLGGDITYRQSATGASSTYGELSIISGSYKAYQQELVIRQGQLLFFGAIDNPALDIRAVRQVNDITVGVLMNGTLKSINSQLFSTPALPENDIISLIATGRKFSTIGEGDGVNVLNTIANLGLNRSQGITNSMRDKLGLDALQITNTGDINNSILTVGKYVTPDIFIRYGVGLFDNQSKISVDYTLSEHLKLQAESGEFQSIDITYTVEK